MQLISKLTDILVRQSIIEEEDKELYSYGMEQGIVTLFNFATAIAVGFVFGMVCETIIFTAAYMPIRIYAGGYHSKTRVRCYFTSILLLVAVLLGIKYLSFIYLVSILLISMVVIIVLSPVANSNKPLVGAEEKVYRKKAIIYAFVLFVLCTVFKGFNLSIVSDSIAMAIAATAFMLILGKIKNHFISRQNSF